MRDLIRGLFFMHRADRSDVLISLGLLLFLFGINWMFGVGVTLAVSGVILIGLGLLVHFGARRR